MPEIQTSTANEMPKIKLFFIFPPQKFPCSSSSIDLNPEQDGASYPTGQAKQSG